MNDQEILSALPPAPSMQLIWTAIIKVGDREDLGASPLGYRFIIPILGGRFYSGPGVERLDGEVLPGGADRQLLRQDGVKELDALYEMRADAGEVVTIRNRVLVDETRKPERYAMSTIQVTAPSGPLEWLNRRVLIGTLQSLRPERDAVVVQAWMVGNE